MQILLNGSLFFFVLTIKIQQHKNEIGYRKDKKHVNKQITQKHVISAIGHI